MNQKPTQHRADSAISEEVLFNAYNTFSNTFERNAEDLSSLESEQKTQIANITLTKPFTNYEKVHVQTQQRASRQSNESYDIVLQNEIFDTTLKSIETQPKKMKAKTKSALRNRPDLRNDYPKENKYDSKREKVMTESQVKEP